MTSTATTAPSAHGSAPARAGSQQAGARARLVLADGAVFEGRSFGAHAGVAGEVVFCTGMVGYPESLTDPSYAGQLLVCTYPMIGNYGVPPMERAAGSAAAGGDDLPVTFESERIHASALIVNDYSEHHSHWHAARSLAQWLADEGVPGVRGIDTRSLTMRLREHGSMLGRIEVDGAENPRGFEDPNLRNLVAEVSVGERTTCGGGDKRVALIDCGCKGNILRSLVGRGVEVVRVPWGDDLQGLAVDGLMISNGPGDPALVDAAAATIRAALDRDVPTFGVCMGNQLLARAIGATTFKLKYGHRGQNQPVIECGTNRCFVTSQNHGFAVDTASLPSDWRPWFENLNDGTNEGVRHSWKPFRSVQFHPEACPGPTDTAYLFDEFVRMIHQ